MRRPVNPIFRSSNVKDCQPHDRWQTNTKRLQAATECTELNWTRVWTTLSWETQFAYDDRWNQNSRVKMQRIVNRTTVDIRKQHIASRKTMYRVKLDKSFNYASRWETNSHATTGHSCIQEFACKAVSTTRFLRDQPEHITSRKTMYRVKLGMSLNKTNSWETQFDSTTGQTSIQEFKCKEF